MTDVQAIILGLLGIVSALVALVTFLVKRRGNGHEKAHSGDTKILPVARGEFLAIVHDLAGEQTRQDREIGGLRSLIHDGDTKILGAIGVLGERVARIEERLPAADRRAR